MGHGQSGGRRLGRLLGAFPIVGGLASLVLLTGVASAERGYTTWYGPGFHGRVMASGPIFDENDPTTTASNQFPFGTWLRVTNPTNGRFVYVQVRDRGGFRHALDLSRAAYFQLDPPNPWGFWVDYEVVPGPGEPPRPAAGYPAAPQAVDPPRAAAAQPSSRGGAAPPKPLLRPAVAGAARPTAARPAPLPSTAPRAQPAGEHVVGIGETLRSIAERHGLPLGWLISWNGLADPDALTVGQRLRLTAPPRRYVVKPGDTLNGIADGLGVSRAAILVRNEIGDPNALVVGQELVVPN